MRINIDPVVSSRIKTAWAALPPDQQNRIAPLLANANQFALLASQTKTAPPFPMLGHEALLAKSALTDDRDGVLKTLQPDIIFDVGSEGEIWGTGKYQQLDPGWAGSVASWLEHLLIGKHAFNNAAPEIIIPNQVQIGIAGDWGTGEWRTDPNNPAPSADVGYHLGFLKPQITIHLGDVYYAGTKDEEQHLLVQLWPQGSIGSYTLNSNHEMYSGAGPYFDVALNDPIFASQKKCSFFALENDNWVIVCLDSAYYSSADNLYLDGSLHDNSGATVQLDFLKKQVAKQKKVIVMTHHNGMTGDGWTMTTLWSQIISAFPGPVGPAYWYWGHLHAGIVYSPTLGNTLCRCCGHGALPWGQASSFANSKSIAWYENRNANDPAIPQRVFNGFAVLNLDGPNIKETFYDENGGIAWSSP